MIKNGSYEPVSKCKIVCCTRQDENMMKEEHMKEVMLPSATPQHVGLAAPAKLSGYMNTR